ncbi:hypothetical protein PAECIP111891_02166 [Paenibacillus allorhizoplanae]|uniref:Translation initiation factor 2 n=1 Tax=Paenibacillus allorhizoplanae TaxID=2905648 RepID=A0ABM9C4G5_9BACL|nr:hypothetical protein PAECIP111891_02166 [Paenibacillus allorhizoplanae]
MIGMAVVGCSMTVWALFRLYNEAVTWERRAFDAYPRLSEIQNGNSAPPKQPPPTDPIGPTNPITPKNPMSPMGPSNSISVQNPMNPTGPSNSISPQNRMSPTGSSISTKNQTRPSNSKGGVTVYENDKSPREIRIRF